MTHESFLKAAGKAVSKHGNAELCLHKGFVLGVLFYGQRVIFSFQDENGAYCGAQSIGPLDGLTDEQKLEATELASEIEKFNAQ